MTVLSMKGIIGILAGKLTEKYNVPAFVFTDPIYPKKIGLYKGSGAVQGIFI